MVWFILRMFDFIRVKIKDKKNLPHCAWSFLSFDAKHIINFFGLIPWSRVSRCRSLFLNPVLKNGYWFRDIMINCEWMFCMNIVIACSWTDAWSAISALDNFHPCLSICYQIIDLWYKCPPWQLWTIELCFSLPFRNRDVIGISFSKYRAFLPVIHFHIKWGHFN